MTEMQVVWVGTDGERHETEFYPDKDTANDKANEIIREHRPMHKIWLQGRRRTV